MGNKHRPFYRIVVANSTAGRDGGFIEVLGNYNPLTKPSTVKLAGDRALHWLMNGAQPTETVAYLLKREGVLEQYFSARPAAKKNYKFLDKRTATMSQSSVVEPVAAATAVAEPEPVAAPVEAVAEPEPEATPEPEVVAEAEPAAAEEVAEAPAAEEEAKAE